MGRSIGIEMDGPIFPTSKHMHEPLAWRFERNKKTVALDPVHKGSALKQACTTV
jgi:hypothetical protein